MSNPTTPQAQTLGMQKAVNRIIRGLLRTPLLSRAIGARLVIVYVTGRTTGRRYAVPVAYTRDDRHLLLGTPFGWGRNLRTGQPVEIRLKGALRRADVEVFTSEDDVTRLYERMCRDNRQFAKFNKISLDAGGNPNVKDLRSAWATGARAFRLTPQ